MCKFHKKYVQMCITIVKKYRLREVSIGFEQYSQAKMSSVCPNIFNG